MDPAHRPKPQSGPFTRTVAISVIYSLDAEHYTRHRATRISVTFPSVEMPEGFALRALNDAVLDWLRDKHTGSEVFVRYLDSNLFAHLGSRPAL